LGNHSAIFFVLYYDYDNDNQKQKEKLAKLDFKLGRKIMTIAKLTIIALSGAAIMFSGCSTDSRITGTGFDSNQVIDNKLTDLNAVTPQPITGARVAVRSNDSDNEPERFSVVAKVKMLDFENGCWYLAAEDGETYTPVIPKDLTLVSTKTYNFSAVTVPPL